MRFGQKRAIERANPHWTARTTRSGRRAHPRAGIRAAIPFPVAAVRDTIPPPVLRGPIGGKMFRPISSIVVAGLLVAGCTNPHDTYEARMRAADQRIVDSARASTERMLAQAEAQRADLDKRIERYKPELRAYASCNRKASRAVAPQTGDPVSLAIAARSLCRESEATLRKAIMAALDHDPGLAMRAMENARQSILENNAGDIVAARAGASEPQRQPEPRVRDAHGI